MAKYLKYNATKSTTNSNNINANNLAGVDNIKNANGNRKAETAPTNQTAINTNASNLAGTNNIVNAGKSVSAKQEKNDFTNGTIESKTKRDASSLERADAGLKREVQLASKGGKYNDDILLDANGNLYDYAKDIEELSNINKTLNEQRDNLFKGVSYDENTGTVSSNYDKETYDNLTAQIEENDKLLKETEDRANYQNARLQQIDFEMAKESGDEKAINEKAEYYKHYDDDFGERRANYLKSIAPDVIGSALNIADALIDSKKEKQAEDILKIAEELKRTGDIESYNKLLETAKKEKDYDSADPNHFSNKLKEYANEIRAEVQMGVHNPVEKFIADGLDSTANFYAQFLTLGATGSLVSMSLQSASQSYMQNIANGYDQETALLNGLAHGVLSFATEKIGMDNFVKVISGGVGKMAQGQALNYLAKSIGTQALSEGLEEIVEGALGPIVDSKMLGIPIEYNGGELFYSFLVGSFSGGLMAGGGAGAYVVNTQAQYDALNKNLSTLNAMYKYAESRGQLSDIDVQTFAEESQKARFALSAFEQKSVIGDSVVFMNEQVENDLNVEETMQELGKSIKPDVDLGIEIGDRLNTVSNEIDNISQNLLNAQGISMDAGEYTQLSDQERTKFNKDVELLNKALPNNPLSYSTNIFDEEGQRVNAKVDLSTGKIIVDPRGDTSTIVSAIHEVIHKLENTSEYTEIYSELAKFDNVLVNTFNELSSGRYKGADLNTLKSESITVGITEKLMSEQDAQSFIEHLAKYNTSTAYKLLYQFRELTGLFKDNSTLGRVESLLTKALAKQDVVYMSDGTYYSRKYPFDKNLTDAFKIVDDTVKGIHHNVSDKEQLLVTEDKMPYLPNNYPLLYNLKHVFALRGVDIDGKPLRDKNGNILATGEGNNHANLPEDIMKLLPTLMKYPLAVYKDPNYYDEYAKQYKDRYVVFLDAMVDGEPLIALLSPSSFSAKYYSTSITSGKIEKAKNSYGITSVYNKNYLDISSGHFFSNPKGRIKGSAPIYPAGMTTSKLVNTISQMRNKSQKNSGSKAVGKSLGSFEPLLGNIVTQELNKSKQLEIIKKSNPMQDGIHTGIRGINDILTYEEAIADPEERFTTPDYTEEDMARIREEGYVTVYSSTPIVNGAFVTPSKMEAQNYAGNGTVYSKLVSVEDVAWIDSIEGQYADTVSDEEKLNYSSNAKKVISDAINKLGDNYSYSELIKDSNVAKTLNEMERISESFPETYLTTNEERFNQVISEFYDKEVKGKAKDRKMIIYMGLPSSGKSTANLPGEKKMLNAVEFDNDIVKTLIPEFKKNGGLMANAVHEESSIIGKKMLDDLLANGYNIVFPTVGGGFNSLSKTIDKAIANGYDIGVKLVSVTPENATSRLIKRFIAKDRWLNPLLIVNAGNKPDINYEEIKSKYGLEGAIKFYEKVDNNGTSPQYIEQIGNKGLFSSSYDDGGIQRNGRDTLESKEQGSRPNGSGRGVLQSISEQNSSFLNSPNGDTNKKYSRRSDYAVSKSTGKEVKLTDNQKEYFKDSKVRDTDGELMIVYHSSPSAQFYTFDKSKADPEGNLGAGFYFTNIEEDARTNYHEGGADIENRIYHLADEYASEGIDYKVAKERARKEIINGNGTDFEVLLNITNPCYISDHDYATRLVSKNDFLKWAKQNYQFEDDYLTPSGDIAFDSDAVEEFASNISNQLQDILTNDGIIQLNSILLDVLAEGGNKFDILTNTISGYYGQGIGDYDYQGYIEGKYASGEIARRIVEALGYDGIIDETVSTKFNGFNLSPYTTHYLAFNENQIKNVDNLNPTTSKDTRYSKRTQQFAESNVPKSAIFTEEQKEQVRQEVANGAFSYESVSNSEEVQKANERFNANGLEKSYEKYMNNTSPTAQSVIDGEILVSKLAQANDPRWEKVTAKLADDSTIIGKALQAYAIMQRLTPSGQLTAIQRNVNRMQQNLDNKFGSRRAPRLEIDSELRDRLLSSKDVDELVRAREEIYKDITSKIPKTLGDTLDSWRYLAMLGNPRTHIRNFVGNGIFVPTVDMKNAVGAVLEKTIGKKLGIQYKTKSLGFGVISNLTANAEDKARIEEGRKAYDLFKGAIENEQKYERKDFTEKTILGKGLNKISQLNSSALDKEDFIFSKDRFARSYASFMKANNLTAENMSEEMQKRASNYALIEAQKATYRDANAVAEWLNELEYSNKPGLRLASFAKKAVIPFTKTPMNILKRGVEYSPIGLIKTVSYGLNQLNSGKINANEFIDQLASGLTGTAITALGALLASMGIFRTKDDDKDRKKYFDQDNGEQDYSIVTNEGSYTIDWATPIIMPLSFGAELFNFFDELEGVDGFSGAINAVSDITARIADPMVETTMLQGVKDALSSFANSEGQWLGDMLMAVASNYVGQMFPTVGGQLARTIDDTRRTTYPNDGALDKLIKQILNKLPGLSKKNQPYINREGKEEKSEDLGLGVFGRGILNFFSPGYYSSNDTDKYDEELYRLLESTGDMDAIPSSDSKETTFDKEKIKFNDKEYTQWQSTRWSTEKKYVDKFIDSEEYKDLSDEERVGVIADIRSYAQLIAKKELLDSQNVDTNSEAYNKLTSQIDKVKGAISNGIEIYQYFDYDNNSGSKQAEKIDYLEKSDLTKKQKEYLFGTEGYKKSYAEAYKNAMKKK